MPEKVRARWRVHPAKGRPKGILAIVGTSALIGISSYFVFGGFLHSAIWILAFLSLLSDFLLPTSYVISEEGVRARRLFSESFIPWDKVRRCIVFKDGLKLSPLRDGSRLERFRGVFVPFGDMDPEHLIGLIREKVGEGTRWEEARERTSS